MKPISSIFFTVIFSIIIGFSVKGQDTSAIQFSLDKTRLNPNEMLITIKAGIPIGLKLYAIQKDSSDALFSTVQFDSSVTVKLNGAIEEKSIVKTEKDISADATVRFITDSAIWQQKISLKDSDSLLIKGTITYLYKKGEEYLPGEQKFKIQLVPAEAVTTGDKTSQSDIQQKSLLWIFILAFGGGLLALLTPCVYSMIPVTVSFFTKRSKTKSEGIRNALIYAISIVLIFTLLGFLVTLIFGPAALNNLATNWIANLIFFALFLIFGISFLGAFDINLPSSWTNKSDSKASTKSIGGIFFMALTLVLVSFSCTGPIIGNLLVVASKGSFMGPLIGMLGFSMALALPFALFAFFPSKLNVLGKAGGWLNAVKVCLGFLELALALKFLSNADLVKGWRLLDREIFISLWIVIFFLMGVYLLGKLKFHHDDELPKNDFGIPYLTVTRLFFAIATFAFAVYMVPGLWGAPLKGISAFLPPMGTQDFTASHSDNNTVNTSGIDNLVHPVKYAEQMKIYEPDVVKKYGLVTYFDYAEALAAAKKLDKPLMIDFTGINCVNCRKMEGQVWSDPVVMKKLKEDFVIVSLYVDVQNIELPENEQYTSKALGKKVTTLGDKNADLQVAQFSANSQPYYFFLDGNEKKLVQEGYGYDPDIPKFIRHLDNVTAAYKAKN